MKSKDKIYLTIPMNKELHDKFQYTASYEGRSMSGQVVYLLNRYVSAFERKNGPIELPETKEQ